MAAGSSGSTRTGCERIPNERPSLRGRFVELVQRRRQDPRDVGKVIETAIARLFHALGGLGVPLLADGSASGFGRIHSPRTHMHSTAS